MGEVKIPDVSKASKSSLTRETSSISSQQKKAPEGIDFKGSVKVVEQSKADKLKSFFISEDAKDIGRYILYDIIVPTIRGTIRDVIVDSADRIFLGTTSTPSSLYRERGSSYVRHVDYGRASRTSRLADPRPRYAYSSPRSSFRLNEIYFEYREDAESALEHMIDFLESQGYLSVSDYFSIIRQPNSNYTAENWGWYSLNGATIEGNLGNYYIKLPEPIVIRR